MKASYASTSAEEAARGRFKASYASSLSPHTRVDSEDPFCVGIRTFVLVKASKVNTHLRRCSEAARRGGGGGLRTCPPAY